MEEVATKEFVRDELRETLEELLAELKNQAKPGDKTE
jgi:hypothetical protein